MAEANVCQECSEPFEKRAKGYKRQKCHLLFPGKDGFFCNACFWKLSKEKKRPSSATPGKSPPRKKKYVGLLCTPLKTIGSPANKESRKATGNTGAYIWDIAKCEEEEGVQNAAKHHFCADVFIWMPTEEILNKVKLFGEARRQLTFGEHKKPGPAGYTFCWDNTQIDVKARRQRKGKSVWMQFWALCYAAKNRVDTSELHVCEIPTEVKAVDIPIQSFLPGAPHEKVLRKWLKMHIEDILITHLQTFKGIQHPGLPKHEYWGQMSQRSDVINLGVLDENPSTTTGTIGIMDFLSTKVPMYADGRPYTIITHCDGGAFERMVSAKKVRAPDRGPLRKLQGLEMSAQEFHKRGIMMQIIMDKYFRNSSVTERGTLSNIKSLFAFNSVSTKVMESFNFVEDMFGVVCEGFTCLLAMELLGFGSQQDDPPANLEVKEKSKLLDDTVDKIIDLIWLHPTKESIAVVAGTEVAERDKINVCCGEDVTGGTVHCSNSVCPSGGEFHTLCVELISGETPPQDEDWWCSPQCEGSSRFCLCRKFVEDSTMVQCDKKKQCQYGEWFHMECVGLLSIPGDKWFCASCQAADESRCVDDTYNYCTSLLWMVLNDRLRRTAIRTGNGRMMMEFWKDDGVQFWNHHHYKYLILMHRMIAGTNGWLTARQAADVMWNRTVNISGGAGHNIAMDKYNEFLNCDFKGNLKATHGKYTPAQTRRSSHLAGQAKKDLMSAFSTNVATGRETEKMGFQPISRLQRSRVSSFIEEYAQDKLFTQVDGRVSKQFPNFSGHKLHQQIKSPDQFNTRLSLYSNKLDRGRFASLLPSEANSGTTQST